MRKNNYDISLEDKCLTWVADAKSAQIAAEIECQKHKNRVEFILLQIKIFETAYSKIPRVSRGEKPYVYCHHIKAELDALIDSIKEIKQ